MSVTVDFLILYFCASSTLERLSSFSLVSQISRFYAAESIVLFFVDILKQIDKEIRKKEIIKRSYDLKKN